ncbi:MAG TPA: hypothetical protein VMS74_09985 [Acidimicrobiia bacterium]|nr:hypothetical protein [Acidimicrobiia bacterium]
MRRLMGVVVVALVVLGMAVPAGAAPSNSNTVEVDLSCDEPVGEVTVTIIDGSSGVTAFTASGQVLVIKDAHFEGTITIAVEGGPTVGPLPESFELGSARGGGFADSLVHCTGVYTFEDTFELKRRDLGFLGLGAEFLGASTTVTGSFDFEMNVLAPGA